VKWNSCLKIAHSSPSWRTFQKLISLVQVNIHFTHFINCVLHTSMFTDEIWSHKSFYIKWDSVETWPASHWAVLTGWRFSLFVGCDMLVWWWDVVINTEHQLTDVLKNGATTQLSAGPGRHETVCREDHQQIEAQLSTLSLHVGLLISQHCISSVPSTTTVTFIIAYTLSTKNRTATINTT